MCPLSLSFFLSFFLACFLSFSVFPFKEKDYIPYREMHLTPSPKLTHTHLNILYLLHDHSKLSVLREDNRGKAHARMPEYIRRQIVKGAHANNKCLSFRHVGKIHSNMCFLLFMWWTNLKNKKQKQASITEFISS